MTHKDEKGILHIKCSGKNSVIHTDGMNIDQMMNLIGKIGGKTDDRIRGIVAETLKKREENPYPVAEVCSGCEFCADMPDVNDVSFDTDSTQEA